VASVDGEHATAITAIEYNSEMQTATLRLAGEVTAGEYALQLNFTGELNDKMTGFYRSKYELNGVTRYMATTQFEATDARRAFPCWDEPALKAQFEIVLTVPDKLVCLSNMPCVEQSTPQDGLVTYRFNRTPIMSTYLVAFLLGEMDHVEAATKDGVAIRVFTPVGKKQQGQFALDCAVKV
jgi:puromycin-sensitive aminopeptidase